MVQNNIVLVFTREVISTESKGELTFDVSSGSLPMAGKKWDWASKISDQLATGQVEVEQILDRQGK